MFTLTATRLTDNSKFITHIISTIYSFTDILTFRCFEIFPKQLSQRASLSPFRSFWRNKNTLCALRQYHILSHDGIFALDHVCETVFALGKWLWQFALSRQWIQTTPFCMLQLRSQREVIFGAFVILYDHSLCFCDGVMFGLDEDQILERVEPL